MPLTLEIAWRYMRGHRSHLLSGTARAALASTAIGTTAMVIAMALMTGYRDELQRRLVAGTAAVVAYPLLGETGGESLASETRAALERIPGVERVAAVAYGQGTLTSAGAPQGIEVTLRGVDPGETLGGRSFALAPGPEGVAAVVLGDELARRLRVERGDVLRAALLGFRDGRARFSFESLRVEDTFSTGFSEYDREWALVDRRRGEALGGVPGSELYEFHLRDPRQAAAVARAARVALGPGYLVSEWQEMNRELFTALRVQQYALFLVLGLIVVVSTFNVASTLVVLVRERMRDVGVLTAMGLAPARVRLLFVAYGGALGGAGTLLGLAIGGGAAWLLDAFRVIRFGPDVAAIYFLNSVPFEVSARDLGAVLLFTLTVNLAACLAPAWRAARLDPATALRYE
jgi:lipoprotein-releasing system permease protein